MISPVEWHRRTPNSKRKITPRPSMSPVKEPTIQYFSKQISNNNPSPKITIKKSDLLPRDPTAPIARQFGDVVKKSASYLLKSIGIKKKDLRPYLDRAYQSFFISFDTWMRGTAKTSLRKVNEKEPYLDLLKARLEESENKMGPLMVEFRRWKRAKPKDIFPNIPFFNENIDENPTQNVFNHTEIIDEMIQYLDAISVSCQRKKVNLDQIQDICDQIGEELRTNIEINFPKQLNLCIQLCRLSA